MNLETCLPKADAIIIEAGHLDAGMVGLAERCILIIHAGPGAGGNYLQAAREAGILVASVPDGATEEYAEWALTEIRSAIVGTEPHRSHGTRKLWRVGIVGLGRTGQAVASALREESRIQLWGSDPYVAAETFRLFRLRQAPLAELLGICDIISLHLPAIRMKEEFLNAAAFGMMKRGARLIAVTSPYLVNIRALLDALASGGIQSAVLNVAGWKPGDFLRAGLAPDALPGGLRLLTADLRSDPEAQNRTFTRALNICLACFDGRTPEHLLVDPPLPRMGGSTQASEVPR